MKVGTNELAHGIELKPVKIYVLDKLLAGTGTILNSSKNIEKILKIYLLQDGPTKLKEFFVTKFEGKSIIVTLRTGFNEPVSTSSYMHSKVENLNNYSYISKQL